MRSAVGGLLVALLLFGAAWVCRSESGFARRVAVAHEHLSTLKYSLNDDVGEETAVVSRLPLPIASLAADVREHRAKVSYWRSEYRELTAVSPLSGGNASDASADPVVMLVAANAAFRATLNDTADRAATVDRLDRVIQAYGDVLRAQPANADASYNFEYVARFRDTFAKSKAPRVSKEQPRRVDGELDASIDLPIGPTVHGRPGGPPQDLPMQQFRTVTPMRFEEREELEPGRGPKPKRRG